MRRKPELHAEHSGLAPPPILRVRALYMYHTHLTGARSPTHSPCAPLIVATSRWQYDSLGAVFLNSAYIFIVYVTSMNIVYLLSM